MTCFAVPPVKRAAAVILLGLALTMMTTSAATIYVDDDAPNDPGPGNPDISDPLEDGSAEHPFDTIQEGIDDANTGDEVVVLVGTYDRINFNGKDITVRSTDPDDPDVVETTIISGGPDPYETGTVVMASDGTLSGFLVRNGTIGVCYADSDEGAYSPTITHCVTIGCYYGIKGYVHYHPASIAPVIRNNTITGRLGGIWLDHQAISGGVHALIQNNVIVGIEATYGRGIVYRMHESLPTVTGNIITDWNVGIELVYDTLADERKALMTCNDLWGNVVNYREEGEQPFDLTGVQGNISADPLWVDQAGGDYHLLDGSPCVNAGDPEFAPAPDETDIDGDDRIQQCRVDMGPDETPYFQDCNNNGVADACDILNGTSEDCNENGIPDECDTIEAGDFDSDGDVDLDDFAALADCLAGPEATPDAPTPECVPAYLGAFDFDQDDDVDLADFAVFQATFTG